VTALDLVWVPFHGKVGIFAQKLSSFDLSLSAGAGVINADVDNWKAPDIGESGGAGLASSQWKFGSTVAASSSTIVNSWLPAAHWGAGFRFYVTKKVAVRVDYSQYAYKPGDAWLSPVEFTAGASFLLR
jgi:hypothetical protein